MHEPRQLEGILAYTGVLYCFELIVPQMKEGWSVIDCTQSPPPQRGLTIQVGRLLCSLRRVAHFTVPGLVVALSNTKCDER